MDRIESDETTKVRSLETGDISELFESDRVPITTEELIDEFGDREVEYPRGSERLEAILRASGMEEYETIDEIQLAILNGVRRDAVGRPRYSDRGDEPLEALDQMNRSF